LQVIRDSPCGDRDARVIAFTGGVYRVTPAGALSTIHSGYEQVRGIAYDPTMKRMFIVEHRATLPTMPRLHVFPLDS